MLTFPKEYSLLRVGITQTWLTDFMTCPRRFLYRVNKLKPADESIVYFGNSFHSVLEFVYKGGKVSAVENFLSGIVKDNDLQDIVFATATEYFKYYKKDDAKILFKECEKQFDVVKGVVRYRGKMDAVAKYLKTPPKGASILFEHKTRSKISSSEEQRISIDFQTLFYILVLEEMGVATNVLIYNRIKTPSLRKGKEENSKDFYSRVCKDIAGRPDEYFKRYTIPLTKGKKENAQRELMQIISRLQEFIFDAGMLPEHAEEIFYKNSSACDAPFQCKYLEACSTGCCDGLVKMKTFFPELDEVQIVKKENRIKAKIRGRQF